MRTLTYSLTIHIAFAFLFVFPNEVLLVHQTQYVFGWQVLATQLSYGKRIRLDLKYTYERAIFKSN